MERLLLSLIAPFLDTQKVVDLGWYSLIRTEISLRYRHILDADDLKQISNFNGDTSHMSPHLSALVHFNNTVHVLSNCKLLDPRTKARILTYLETEEASSVYRDLYIWFVKTFILEDLTTRSIEGIMNGGETTSVQMYLFVHEKSGSFRIYNRKNNEVIGYYDRCSKHVVALPQHIDTAVNLSLTVISNQT